MSRGTGAQRLLIIALLAGCAHTPQELREAGPRSVHELQLPPERAAGCIARNTDEYNDAWSATVRAGRAPGQYEVVARIPRASIGTAAVIEVSPRGPKSIASMWLHPSMADSGVQRYRAQAFKGC